MFVALNLSLRNLSDLWDTNFVVMLLVVLFLALLCMASGANPTIKPIARPTQKPSMKPTFRPTALPSETPTNRPSGIPSGHPSSLPSLAPKATDVPVVPVSLPNLAPRASTGGEQAFGYAVAMAICLAFLMYLCNKAPCCKRVHDDEDAGPKKIPNVEDDYPEAAAGTTNPLHDDDDYDDV